MDAGLVQNFRRDGYTVVRGMFSKQECETLIEHYMKMRAEGPKPGDYAGVDVTSSDPLKKFPRMIQMHRWDELSRKWLIDPRIADCLTALMGCAPLAVQSMIYFKPPGARGQAMHQDNYYLKVKPGTCMAVWLALEDTDEENGCMQVVPGSGALPVLCVRRADITKSFTDVSVPLHPEMPPKPAVMKAGDVLVFNGSLIHGSLPNISKDRFRRSLIGHYVPSTTRQLTIHDQPVLRMDGEELMLEDSAGGAPCGVWTDLDGVPAVEISTTVKHEVSDLVE
jgi:phytanoyl-CoA hydroxylase